MENIFLHFVNLSITAGWIILAILVMRLFLKKAPKWIYCLLWAIAGVRLVLPFSIESIFSLIPSTETIDMTKYTARPYIETGFSGVDNRINNYLGSHYFEEVTQPNINLFSNIMSVLAVIWIVGIIAMILYTVISYLRLRRKLKTATLFKDNIYQSEAVTSPFILGIIKPKIYLAYEMNEKSIDYCLVHEQAHIKRKDYLIKPIAFLILTIYWFNPLVWVAYILLCRDIELACDEKVIKNMKKDERKEYSKVLIQNSVNRRTIAACPIAFGEVGVKERVKSVMNYKKPAFWIIIIAVVICAVITVCFLTNPKTNKIDEKLDSFLSQVILDYNESHDTYLNFACEDHVIFDVRTKGDETTVYGMVFYMECRLSNNSFTLKNETGAHIPTAITVKKDKKGEYSLVEYWTAEDGNRYSKSIKDKFPWYTWSKALDTQRYIAQQKKACESAAEKYFGIDTSVTDIGGVDNPEGISVKYTRIGRVDRNTENKLCRKGNGYQVKMSEGFLPKFLPIFKFDSLSELKIFKEEFSKEISFSSPTNIVNNEFQVTEESFDKISNQYDDEFFENKSLLLIYMPTGNSIIRPKVGSIGKSDDGKLLHVNVDTIAPEVDTLDMTYWFITIAVDKEYIESCDTFTASPWRVISNSCYVYNESVDLTRPYLYLHEEDGTFEFCYSDLSSYIAFGKYTKTNDTLTLKTDDGKYTYIFKIEGDSFIFDSSKSSEIPKYRYDEGADPVSPVPDGAEFKIAFLVLNDNS